MESGVNGDENGPTRRLPYGAAFDQRDLVAGGVECDFVEEGTHEDDASPTRPFEVGGVGSFGEGAGIEASAFIADRSRRLAPSAGR